VVLCGGGVRRIDAGHKAQSVDGPTDAPNQTETAHHANERGRLDGPWPVRYSPTGWAGEPTLAR